MLWTIIVILLVLWLLGLLGHVGGSLIHLLLVIAVIVLIINLVQGRRGPCLGTFLVNWTVLPSSPTIERIGSRHHFGPGDTARNAHHSFFHNRAGDGV